MAGIRRLWKKQSGQSLTELALILPLLLYLMCGVVDFGRVMFTYMQLNLVSQEAVRLGGIGEKDAAIRTYAVDRLQISNPGNVTVLISPADNVRKSGDYVTVKIEEQVEWITPLLSNILPSPLQVHVESTMRVE